MQSLSITPRSAAPQVTMSDAAAAKVAELLEREDDSSLVLRLGVRPGGCSGFSYEMYFDSQVDEADHVSEYGVDVSEHGVELSEHGDDVSERGSVRLVVDPQSMTMLAGAEIDYRDGLQGAGFHIQNPNETRSCGCGKSFS
jgi:iron-sulfur cluster assembly protein/iron-sulfur cluster insertion protein